MLYFISKEAFDIAKKSWTANVRFCYHGNQAANDVAHLISKNELFSKILDVDRYEIDEKRILGSFSLTGPPH